MQVATEHNFMDPSVTFDLTVLQTVLFRVREAYDNAIQYNKHYTGK